MGTNRKWTEESVKPLAANCGSAKEFERNFSGAYQFARRAGLKLFESTRRAWTETAIREEAVKWDGKTALQNGCQSAYAAATRMGILDSIYPHKYKRWGKKEIVEAAKAYPNKKLFALENPSASNAAYRKFPGLLDELFSNERLPMANDTIYIWRAVGQFHNGHPIYKIGVTSARLGDWRIRLCAAKAGFEFELVCNETLAPGVRATEIEKKLLRLGEPVDYSGFDGCTEFRAMSDSALYAAVSVICLHL